MEQEWERKSNVWIRYTKCENTSFESTGQSVVEFGDYNSINIWKSKEENINLENDVLQINDKSVLKKIFQGLQSKNYSPLVMKSQHKKHNIKEHNKINFTMPW